MRALFGAMVVVVALAAGQAAVPASAQQTEAPADVVDFGRQVAALVERGDYEWLVDMFITHEDECPLLAGEEDLCRDIDDGQTVDGYLHGGFETASALASRERLTNHLRSTVERISGTGFRLYSVGLTGLAPRLEIGCANCRGIVLSTPDELQTETQDVMYFNVVSTQAGLRLHAFVSGNIAIPEWRGLIEGGEWNGIRFVAVRAEAPAVNPGVPGTGTGLAASDGSPARWMVAAGALVMLASLSLLLGRARREGRS